MSQDMTYEACRAVGALEALEELLSMADPIMSMRLNQLQPLISVILDAVREAMPAETFGPGDGANDD